MPKPEQAALTYDPELGPGYFVQIRSDFLRFPGFTCYAKVLYLILCSYAGEGVEAWPGQVLIAEEMGVTDRHVRNVLGELEAAGLVTTTRQGLNKPNKYHVHKLPVLERNKVPIPNRNKVPLQRGTRFPTKAARGSVEVQSVVTFTEIQDTSPLVVAPEPEFGTPEWAEWSAAKEARLDQLNGRKLSGGRG